MSKLYVGNLQADATETNIRQLFLDHSLSITGVLLKRGGYAFVDCADQSVADRSIDKLNGFNFLGTPLLVEPSVTPAAAAASKKTVTNGTASDATIHSEVTMNGSAYPPVVHADPAGMSGTASTSGAGPSSAGLQGGGERRPRPRMPFGGLSGQQAPLADFPLRMLVSSEMVGAIIGRQGNTIRQITQSTRARVDVHRKDNSGSLEKAITIYGNPENCDNACKKILEVMLQEADNTSKTDVPLKILAHNNLIGRIIGKGGNVIKRIMEETDTKITVSSVADVNSFNPERTISIRGTLDAMAEAERLVVARLRQSYESDLQALAPQSLLYPGLHPMAMMSTLGLGFSRPGGALAGGPGAQGLYGAGPAHYPPMYPAAVAGGAASQNACETVYLYVPSQTVGALIGRKGSYIRNVIRFSGASVKISQEEEQSRVQPLERPGEGHGGADGPPARLPLLEPIAQRRVTVLGSPEAQWKAQFLIFDKMREEGYGAGIEDVRLPVEMTVPTSQVGRIIGKKGQNVREMQRTTGTTIRLPQPSERGAPPEHTLVHMAGPFYSVQSAQRRIRALVAQSGGRPARAAAAAAAAGQAAPHAAAGEPPYKPAPAGPPTAAAGVPDGLRL